jgi:hypothetical protein
MRRAHVPVIAVLLVVLGVALGASGALAGTQLQANARAARQDAARNLRRVRLPSDVTRLSSEPNFAKSFAFSTGPGDRYDAQDHAVWATTASPQTVIAYVKAHPPAGSTADFGTGSGSNTKTGVTSIDIQFSWPDLAEQVLNRTLTVTVVTPPHGSSSIVAQTQSSWFVPRSAAETVPGRVHAVTITVRLGPAVTGPVIKPGGHVHISTYLVWRAARVRALVNEFNGLPIVQPSTEPLGCPLMLTGSAASELTLAFKTGRRGATVSKAQVYIHRGQTWADGGGPCDPISFWIGGTQQTALTSPTFVKQVGKLIGANIS